MSKLRKFFDGLIDTASHPAPSMSDAELRRLASGGPGTYGHEDESAPRNPSTAHDERDAKTLRGPLPNTYLNQAESSEQRQPFSATLAGDNVILSQAFVHDVEIIEVIVVPTGAVTVQLKENGTPITGKYSLGANSVNVLGGKVISRSSQLIISLSGAATVNGTVSWRYYDSDARRIGLGGIDGLGKGGGSGGLGPLPPARSSFGSPGTSGTKNFNTQSSGTNTGQNSGASNQIQLDVLDIPFQVTFKFIAVWNRTGDLTVGHFSDWGIYSEPDDFGNSNLICDVGPQTGLTNTTLQDLIPVQGTITLAPGRYLFAFTSNVAGADIEVYETTLISAVYTTATPSVAGQLPDQIAVVTSVPTHTTGDLTHAVPVIALHS